MKFTKKELIKRFEKNYEFLLEHDFNVSGAREAKNFVEHNFDALLPYIHILVKHRQDGIDTSNEKAALGFALEEMNLI